LEGTIASAIDPSNLYLPIFNPLAWGGHHFIANHDVHSSMEPRPRSFYLNRLDLDFG